MKYARWRSFEKGLESLMIRSGLGSAGLEPCTTAAIILNCPATRPSQEADRMHRREHLCKDLRLGAVMIMKLRLFSALVVLIGAKKQQEECAKKLLAACATTNRVA